MSRGKRKPSLRDLSFEKPHLDEFIVAMTAVHQSSDREAALLSSGLVEMALQAALTAKFVPLGKTELADLFFEKNCVLGTFADRIDIGYATGIYGQKTRRALDAVRNIRNLYAHTMKNIPFSHELIAKECKHFPRNSIIGEETAQRRTRLVYLFGCTSLTDALLKYSLACKEGGKIDHPELFLKFDLPHS